MLFVFGPRLYIDQTWSLDRLKFDFILTKLPLYLAYTPKHDFRAFKSIFLEEINIANLFDFSPISTTEQQVGWRSIFHSTRTNFKARCKKRWPKHLAVSNIFCSFAAYYSFNN